MRSSTYLLSILQSTGPLLLSSLCCTSIGEQNMISGINSDGLCEEVDSGCVVLRRERLVSLIFELVSHVVENEMVWDATKN